MTSSVISAAARGGSKRRSLAVFAAVAALFAGVGTADAHHSTAAYDYSKQVNLAGTVKQFLWTNPHMFVKVLAPFGKDVAQWNIEVGTPNINVRHGWKQTDLKPGDKITLEVAPLRDGSPGGTLIRLKLPDGRTLYGPAVDILNAPRPN